MNTYVLLISLKKLYRQIILLGNKLDKMYKIKYLFKQKLFRIIPSSVLKAFACINILSYITCLVYYLIYHSEFIQKNKQLYFFSSQNSSSCFPCQCPAKNQTCKINLSQLYSYVHINFWIKINQGWQHQKLVSMDATLKIQLKPCEYIFLIQIQPVSPKICLEFIINKKSLKKTGL